MHPILFEVHGHAVGTYALMALLALAAGVGVFAWLGRRAGHDPLAFVEMGLWAFIIALVSSKLFGVLVDFDPSRARESLTYLLRFGGHYYVGFLAGTAYLVLAFRRHRVPLGTGLDILAPALALAHGIGRIGCFLAGCCWGKACALPWAVTFTSTAAHEITGVPLNIPLHPTQLYESAAELLVFAMLLWKILRRPSFAGSTFLLYAVIYGLLRGALELLRADPRGSVAGLPTSQPVAIGTAGLAAVLAVILWKRHAAGRSAARDSAAADRVIVSGATPVPAPVVSTSARRGAKGDDGHGKRRRPRR